MLKINDLKFEISGTSILNGVDLCVESGETVGLIGPNGSGKTTLFNCISGFSRAQHGQILFEGTDITRLRPYRRAKLGIGRVFQNFGIFREMTALENVVTAIEGRDSLWKTFFPWGARNRAVFAEAREVLHDIGLGEKAGSKAGSLSGGQMRLLEIIRTLAFGAELFLLDEPTAGVSPKMKEDVATLIRKLQTQKKTIFIIEHDINFIQKFCDRILVMDVGRVILDGTPEAVRSNRRLQEIYFGSELEVKQEGAE